MSQLAVSLEKLALSTSKVEHYSGPSSAAKYQKLVSGLGTESVVGILTIVSEWFTQVYSKAQIIMLTSKLYKQVNGSDEQVILPKKKSVEPVTKSFVDERLGAL
jgi:hypothetical protein